MTTKLLLFVVGVLLDAAAAYAGPRCLRVGAPSDAIAITELTLPRPDGKGSILADEKSPVEFWEDEKGQRPIGTFKADTFATCIEVGRIDESTLRQVLKVRVTEGPFEGRVGFVNAYPFSGSPDPKTCLTFVKRARPLAAQERQYGLVRPPDRDGTARLFRSPAAQFLCELEYSQLEREGSTCDAGTIARLKPGTGLRHLDYGEGEMIHVHVLDGPVEGKRGYLSHQNYAVNGGPPCFRACFQGCVRAGRDYDCTSACQDRCIATGDTE